MTRGTRARRVLPVLLALSAAALLLGLLGMTVGSSTVGWRSVLGLLSGEGVDPATRSILLEIRLPRILLAAVVGAALSAAGVAFQAILRNPLADPYVLGVSGGAAVGAALLAALGPAAQVFVLARPLAAFVGAAATLVILFRLARVRGRTGSVALLLVGVILNAIDSAIILCLLTTGDPSRFQSVIFFLVGSIASIPGLALSGVAVLLLGGLVVLVAMSHRLNLIALGEETAGHLGVPVERTLWISLIAASLVTAAAVAFAGLVGFVGLIVPHLLRTLLGPDHRLLIPASVLAGAAFLVFADTIARTVIAPVEIPVGAITALLGGPLFLTLFLRKIRQG